MQKKKKPDKRIVIQQLFECLREEMLIKLGTNSKFISHPSYLGDETELNWISMLQNYLPSRYTVDKAIAIDSNGNLSDQLDIVIYDKHYSPFVFNRGNTKYVIAESIYAVFEVKPSLDKQTFCYASKKINSVRKLKRTSIPITHAGGTYPPKELNKIIGGILTSRSSLIGDINLKLEEYSSGIKENEKLDLICSLSNGTYLMKHSETNTMKIEFCSAKNSLMFFFLNLIHNLQILGTVPMADIKAYYHF